MREHGHHVAVVGLMGSGKTTVARLVARELGVVFRDNDVALVAQTGMEAAELADWRGMQSLHDAEADALLNLLVAAEQSVIAAAASTIEVPACRDALGLHAYVAWLHAEIDVLAERASRGRHRPLNRDVVAQLALQSRDRDPLYAAAADVIVQVDEADAETAANRILDALGNRFAR